jgi:ribosomal protein S12 methylthiotransferase
LPPENNRFYILTLGCPKNEVDSDLLASSLLQGGWKKAEKPQEADIVVVNTCSFIQPAVEESVEAILELTDLRERGRRRLVVAGCLVARYGKSSLSSLLPEVDLFVDIPEYLQLPQLIADLTQQTVESGTRSSERAYSSTLARGYVYIKIAEGCRRRCTFCTIPAIRGTLRSRAWEEVVEEGRYFVEKGAKEIVFIAQDTTSYGIDLYGQPSLALLLRRMVEMTGDFRVRVMYLHPSGLGEELLEALQNPRVCNYLEIPLQHVDSKILKAMGRGGGYSEYRNLLSGVRDYLGEVALRSSFMVGFPGEDDRSFAKLRDFIAEMRFDWLGLFRYSQEDETPASSLAGGVSRTESECRLEELAALQDEIMRERALGFIAEEFTVLVEGESTEAPGYWEARSWREAPEIDGVVFIQHNQRLRPGTFCEVEITDTEGIDLIGILKGWKNGEKKGRGKGHLEPSQRPDRAAHLPGAGYSPFTFKRKPL